MDRPELPDDEFANRPHLVKHRQRAIFWTRLSQAIAVAWALFVSVFLVAVSIDGDAAREQLLSCTTPDGECYKQGLKNQEKAIKQLYEDGLAREKTTREIVVLAAFCAKLPDVNTEQEIQSCIEERMK